MSRYHVRCSGRKCRARHVLAKHPDDYKRLPKCWACGEAKYVIDPWMTKRDTRAMACLCSGYKWEGNMTGAMHRKGSKYCWYRADGTQRMPGDPDFNDLEYEAECAA